ncbi:hypothetical protein L5B71_07205 [Avibacterium sp. 21-586]|uniref:hypothetical protein n=1 Tax=Avibacterium sp. 21-586 TaxID=2911534 RepID=UPI00224580FA|nr:hypothetical protein [Avibacterium sp. 21-586]MCW9710638.1 hypothetical protein [Avibacterium sp. 21-586]
MKLFQAKFYLKQWNKNNISERAVVFTEFYVVKNLWKSTALYYLVHYCWLITYFFVVNNGFRSLSDFLSFAYPKERKQRKRNPDQTTFPHSNKIFLTKNQPDVRLAPVRRDFSKNFISIRAVWTGNGGAKF